MASTSISQVSQTNDRDLFSSFVELGVPETVPGKIIEDGRSFTDRLSSLTDDYAMPRFPAALESYGFEKTKHFIEILRQSPFLRSLRLNIWRPAYLYLDGQQKCALLTEECLKLIFNALSKEFQSLEKLTLIDAVMLDPKIAGALGQALVTNSVLSTLELRHSQLSVQATAALAAGLMFNSSVKFLNLRHTDLGKSGLTALGSVLNAHSLVGLKLAYPDSVYSEDEVGQFARSLGNNSSLRQFDWKGTPGVEAGRAFGAALLVNTTLLMLNLSSNELRDTGARAIAESLLVNSTLMVLNISHNEIGDQGAYSVGTALRGNRSLRVIDLSNNKIRDAGILDIGEGVKGSTSIQELDVSRNRFSLHGLSRLVPCLTSNQSLNVLSLRKCTAVFDGSKRALGPEVGVLMCEMLRGNTTLVSLDVSENGIGIIGTRALATGLKINSTLRTLRMNQNSLKGSLEEVEEMLGMSTPLQELELGGNRISDLGGQGLLRAFTGFRYFKLIIFFEGT